MQPTQPNENQPVTVTVTIHISNCPATDGATANPLIQNLMILAYSGHIFHAQHMNLTKRFLWSPSVILMTSRW